MSTNTTSLDARVELIASLIGDNFLRVARALRDLQDEQPDIFLKVAGMLELSPRKAYALARIARQFDDLGVPDGQLHHIGWTKLQIIGRYLTEENAEHLLQLAGQHTVHDLELLLQGEVPVADAKVLTLYFSPADFERLKTALLAHGAAISGNGLVGREKALMALVDRFDAS